MTDNIKAHPGQPATGDLTVQTEPAEAQSTEKVLLEQVHEWRNKASQLEERVGELQKAHDREKDSKDTYYRRCDKLEGEIAQMHAVFDSLGVPRIVKDETSSYCSDQTLSMQARFTRYMADQMAILMEKK